MLLLTSNKFTRNLLILASIMMAANLVNIFINTPMIPEQHWAQKIFYIHVPIAWNGFLSYFIVMIAGIQFLRTNETKWDHLGLAAAEVGTFFITLVLITGPIWATPIWGKPWVWEPRLTTTLILFLIYVGYFMIRKFGGHKERVARYNAVIGILAFLDVPLIFFSVKFWAPQFQLHPQVEMAQQSTEILYPFFFSLFTFTMLCILMLSYRSNILNFHLLKKTNNV